MYMHNHMYVHTYMSHLHVTCKYNAQLHVHVTCTCTTTCTCHMYMHNHMYMSHVHAQPHVHVTCTCATTCTCHMHGHMYVRIPCRSQSSSPQSLQLLHSVLRLPPQLLPTPLQWAMCALLHPCQLQQAHTATAGHQGHGGQPHATRCHCSIGPAH